MSSTNTVKGNVTVTNPTTTVTANLGTVTPLTQSGSVPATYTRRLSGTFFAATGAATTATTVLAAGSNLNGVVIRSIMMKPVTADAAFYIGATAPSGSARDTTKICVGYATGAGTYLYDMTTFVGSGFGIFLITDAGAAGWYQINYDIL